MRALSFPEFAKPRQGILKLCPRHDLHRDSFICVISPMFLTVSTLNVFAFIYPELYP